MSLTVDGKFEFKILDISENVTPVYVDKDRWIEGVYRKVIITIGYMRRWKILAYDQTVKAETLTYLKNKLMSGEKIDVKIDKGELFQVQSSTYILDLNFNMEGKIDLTLQEA